MGRELFHGGLRPLELAAGGDAEGIKSALAVEVSFGGLPLLTLEVGRGVCCQRGAGSLRGLGGGESFGGDFAPLAPSAEWSDLRRGLRREDGLIFHERPRHLQGGAFRLHLRKYARPGQLLPK